MGFLGGMFGLNYINDFFVLGWMWWVVIEVDLVVCVIDV